MPFLATRNLEFHYRQQGQADGLPVLFVHGSYGSGRWWEPLLALLPEEIFAIAPDLRGCGQSEKPNDGYTIETQAEDLWQFAQALGWQGFDLVAHSTGGAIAIELALTHPGLLRALILVDPVPVEGIFTPIETLMALEQMQHDAALLAHALALLMPTLDQTEPQQAAFFAKLVDDAHGMAPAAFTAVAESLNHWNRLADAKRLTLPTLLLWGDQDAVVTRDTVARTLIAIPGANNLEILHGVGHSPMIEAPLVLAEKLIDFLSEDFGEFDQVRASAYQGKQPTVQ